MKRYKNILYFTVLALYIEFFKTGALVYIFLYLLVFDKLHYMDDFVAMFERDDKTVKGQIIHTLLLCMGVLFTWLVSRNLDILAKKSITLFN